MIETFITDWITAIWAMFTDGRKRLSILYLLVAVVIGLGWLSWKRGSRIQVAMLQLFNPSLWWARSAQTDYQLLILNQGLMLLFKPLMMGKLVIVGSLFLTFHNLFERPVWDSLLPSGLVAVLFTLCLFLLDDATRYGLHRLMHLWPMLWAFHRVHHTAQVLTPFTVLRTHPVEAVLFAWRGILVQGICIGVFVFFFGQQVTLLTWLGASVFTACFNITGANLRHSHIRLSYWPWLEKWLISPAQHQLHHSTAPQHWNLNYGAVLALWDRLGGTLIISSSTQKLRFGLLDQQQHDQQLSQLYWCPFLDFRRALYQWFSLKRRRVSYQESKT